jgi:thiosulfate dehydrogenase (quinone) large subunit
MEKNYIKTQIWTLVILRISIGWHFLYEGIVKVSNPDWSSIGFLLDSKGLFEGIFHSMANNSNLVSIINYLNIWGLILIGLSLILGLLTKPALISGIVLLAFYYLSHPPIIGVEYILPSEGSYLFVNKNLIELFAMSVLFVFPTNRIIGLDRLFFGSKQI